MADQQELQVDFMSDLHADRWDDAPFDYAAHKKNNIAIVAGDIANGCPATLEELKRIATVYETVLYVDGNHEFKAPDLTYNFDFEAVEQELREGIAKIPNVIYLRDKAFVKDGVAIIGRNGHWDYTMGEGVTEKEAIEDAATTFKSTFTEAASFAKLARRDYYALRDQVIALNQDPSIHTIVVVTHTVPHKGLLNAGKPVSEIWKARAGAGIMQHLRQYDLNKKIKTWLFGHQHTTHEQKIDGILYRENPRGANKKRNRDYKPAIISFS